MYYEALWKAQRLGIWLVSIAYVCAEFHSKRNDVTYMRETGFEVAQKIQKEGQSCSKRLNSAFECWKRLQYQKDDMDSVTWIIHLVDHSPYMTRLDKANFETHLPEGTCLSSFPI